MGSASSSPDDRCDCGHDRRSHGKLMEKDACWACWENGGDDAAGAQHVHFADLMHPKDDPPQGGAEGAEEDLEGCPGPGECFARGGCKDRCKAPDEDKYACTHPEDYEGALCTCEKGPRSYEDPPIQPEPDCPAHGVPEVLAQPKPPQPERRTPYAVAYCVQGGHLYEIALPGDASVTAEDGCLKIVHPNRQILGLVQVAPVSWKEAADAADSQK